MRTIWTISLYLVSEKTGYRVKIEGQPGSAPRVFASADDLDQHRALLAAADQMSQFHQGLLAKFLKAKE